MVERNTTINLIQISDTHLVSKPYPKIHGKDSKQHLTALLVDIIQKINNGNFSVSCYIHSGDVADDHYESRSQFAYETLFDIFDYIKISDGYDLSREKWIFTRGNHDIAKDFHKLDVIENFHASKSIVEYIPLNDHWAVINLHTGFINSEYENRVAGCFENESIELLTQVLENNPNRYILVNMHHNLMDTSTEWLNNYRFENQQKLLDLLANNPKIKLAIHGHIHKYHVWTYKNLQIVSSPPCSFTFEENENNKTGYLHYQLFANGSFKHTFHTFRLAQFINN